MLASGFANLADGIATVAWAWVASLMTRDPLFVAAVAMALRLPWVVFALPAGVITDRVDRRRLILGMDLARATAFAAAAVLLALMPPLTSAARGVADPVAFAGILMLAAVVGAAEVFRDNAAQTMLPSIVPHHRLEAANGRLWSVEMVGNALIGPAAGAFLVAAAVPLPFAANAAAYLAAVGLVLSLGGRFRPAGQGPRDWRAELGEGLRFLRGAPLLRQLAWITGVWNMVFQMALIALVLHAQENLGLGAQAYGLALAGGAVGGVAGGLAAGRIVRAVGPGSAARWSLAASAPCFAAMAVAPGAMTLALVLAVFEFAGLVWNTVSVAYRQHSIPDRLLGRVNSVYRLLAWGMMPVGLLASGLVVRGLDGPLPREAALTAPFLLAAAGSAVLAAAAWRPLGRGFAAC